MYSLGIEVRAFDLHFYKILSLQLYKKNDYFYVRNVKRNLARE